MLCLASLSLEVLFFKSKEQGRSRELTKLQRETREAQNTSYRLQWRFQWRPEVGNPKVVGASEGNHSCPGPPSKHWLRCKPFFARGHLRKANSPSFHSRSLLLWHTDVTTNVKFHICRNFGSLLWWPSQSGHKALGKKSFVCPSCCYPLKDLLLRARKHGPALCQKKTHTNKNSIPELCLHSAVVTNKLNVSASLRAFKRWPQGMLCTT